MYTQNDDKWGHISWYDKSICNLFREITKHYQKFSREQKDGEKLLKSTSRLSKHVNEIVKIGERKQSKNNAESLSESGCWHTSLSNMLGLFNIKIRRKKPTPLVVVQVLQDSMLGTLTGYCETPFIDPVSIITNGQIQLMCYRDFGGTGVGKGDQEFNDLLSKTKHEDACAIVNVNSHEFKGNEDPHYVLVTNDNGPKYETQDPGWPENKSLFDVYERFYQISIYQRVKANK